MKPFCLPLCLALGLGSIAHAQPAEPATAAFLEKRVPEELATDGVVLSRQNLGLRVEQLGDRWLISLVDLTTGRVAASTKADALPADREAAVATLTHVVAELSEQVIARPARADTEVAEQKLKRTAIHFGEGYNAEGHHTSQQWIAYRGEQGPRLSTKDFYREVGRTDLIESYDRRYTVAGVFFATGIAAFIGSAAWGIQQGTNVTPRPMYLAAAGAVSWYVCFAISPKPISENEARALADAHNQKLRAKLGLPVVSQLRDVRIAPYVGEHDGGLVLAAKF